MNDDALMGKVRALLDAINPQEPLFAAYGMPAVDAYNALQALMDARARVMLEREINYPTEDMHCWCGEHGRCPSPEPDYCYEKMARSGKEPRPFR